MSGGKLDEQWTETGQRAEEGDIKKLTSIVLSLGCALTSSGSFPLNSAKDPGEQPGRITRIQTPSSNRLVNTCISPPLAGVTLMPGVKPRVKESHTN